MKWEYITVTIEKYPNKEVELNSYGSKEWELVSVDSGVAYFKRPDFSDIADKAVKMIALASNEDHVIFKGIQEPIRITQTAKREGHYSYDTVQDGYVIYDTHTLVKLSGVEVENLLNND